MKITVEKMNGRKGFSENLDDEDNQFVVNCFNALTSVGYAPEYILKKMYDFSSQFVKKEETENKEETKKK
jgi:hypothetical protein